MQGDMLLRLDIWLAFKSYCKKVNLETFERIFKEHILPHLFKELNSATGAAVAYQYGSESIDYSEPAQVSPNILCTIKCHTE